MTDDGTGQSTAGPIQLTTSTAPPPPHPFDAEWHVNLNGQNYGPYTGHKLKEYAQEGRVTADTQVVRVGEAGWHRIADDPVLKMLFAPAGTAQALRETSTVTAREGATVVQVTNNLAPNPMLMLDDGGIAAPKSPGVALLLSLLICGVGQMYNGQVGKGILMLIGCILLWLAFLGWIIWIWSMIDAYQTAKGMNLRYQQRMLAGAAAIAR